MIKKSLAIKVLNVALSTGGDYAEIYLEDTKSNGVSVENGVVESSMKSENYGAGVRILKGFNSVYGFTSDLSEKSLVDLASKLSANYSGERVITVKDVKTQKKVDINNIKDHLYDVPTEEKVSLLKECNSLIKSVNPEKLVRIINSFSDYKKDIEIYIAEGETAKHFFNTEERGRMVFLAVAMGDGKLETYFAGPGRFDGWNWFKNTLDWRGISKEVGEKAIMMLNAKECPSGKYSVVISNGWGGVLFHEACGHPLEAEATAKKLSVFSDSIGEQIASPVVSAYDDGSLPNEWGSNNIDSEGVKTQKNELIKDGICTGFLVDRLNGRRLGMEPNGCSRRQSYKYPPTSRMSNTYIAAGKDNPEDIIKDTKLGIYVTNFGGGSVNPANGEFNFSASEAYIIRDGKVCEPVRGCTLIGTGKEVLMNIDRVGNDLDLGQGMCGAASGSIPVNVGQPTIRIKEITVGGRGGELK